MTIYWSSSTRGFYDSRINISIPDDAREITEQQRDEMLAALNGGQHAELMDGTVVVTEKVYSLEQLKARKIAAITAAFNDRLAIGYPVSGDRHVALDQSSRADMSAMAATALAVTSGSANWPDSYKTGWITVENSRIPLETAADGLALAAAVGDHYAALRQHARDLKDTVLATDDAAALEAIDIETDWPA